MTMRLIKRQGLSLVEHSFRSVQGGLDVAQTMIKPWIELVMLHPERISRVSFGPHK
jgi:hypothetical protein